MASLFLKLLLTSILLTPTNAKSEDLIAAVYSIEPFSYYNNQGKLVGILPDFIEIVSKRFNINIHIKQYPYGRMLQSLKNGNSDFTIHIRSSNTEHIADSLVKVDDIEIYITGKKGIEINSYNDLRELRISQPRGTFFDDRFDSDKDLQVVKVNGHESSTKLMLNGRVDAVAAPIESVYYELSKLHLNNLPLGKPYLLSKKALWLRFSKKSRQHKDRGKVANAVKTLVEEGVFKETYSRYLPKPIELE
jgi:ABC-type amino acid transport substrate-binding protein